MALIIVYYRRIPVAYGKECNIFVHSITLFNFLGPCPDIADKNAGERREEFKWILHRWLPANRGAA